ncbi:MAG: MBOAT family protein [Lachnospiraceae bacterium]|nr:MBOAT family protein [Lachnospiraceae bacterium]
MGFTEITFLFIVMPVSVLLYFLSAAGKRITACNFLLAVFSIAVYYWVSPETLLFFLVFTLCAYACGVAVSAGKKNSGKTHSASRKTSNKSKNGKGKLVPAVVGICLFTLTLAFFKYIPAIMKAFGEKKIFGTPFAKIAVPVGISFITFEAISYIVDVYRGDAPCGSILDVFLFISFFPKIVSGPIVLWKDFYPQLKNRKSDSDGATQGIDLIIIGFAKKAIIADTFGNQIALILKGMAGYGADAGMHWLIAILYFFQIYFDFAGYSDIAIGLMKIFGFDIKANFDSPYTSASITEFWRRWHISLGTWFREYVYIPLGGNRRGNVYVNLSVVFLLTGIWHGANLTFIVWGALHGFFVVTERAVRNIKKRRSEKRLAEAGEAASSDVESASAVRKVLAVVGAVLNHVRTLIIVFVGWMLFRSDSLTAFGKEVAAMFDFVSPDGMVFTWRFYLNGKIFILLAIAVFSSFAALIKLPEAVKKNAENAAVLAIRRLALLALFAVDIIFIVNSTYSPFLYFQF